MYVYFYLRQEQDKIIHKDQYNEAWNEISKKGKKKTILDIRFVAPLVKPSSSEISMGLGLLSCITLIFQLTTYSSLFSFFSFFYINAEIIYGLISSIGLFASIAGFFIGAFGAFQTNNVSLGMKYGGVLFSVIGILNFGFVAEFFLQMANW